MPAAPDPELERWERMAAQEHPDILPGCVEALEAQTARLTERADSVQEIHDAQQARFNRVGVMALAGSATIGVQIGIIERVAHVDVPEELVIGAACVAVGIMLFKESFRMVQYRFGLARLRTRAQQAAALHQKASERAHALGLPGE